MTRSSPDSHSRITVERLRCTYLVSRDHSAPDSLRPRLDALARDDLAAQCRALLPAVLDVEDPSVWFIRRLEVEVGLDVSAAPDDLLARSWGQQIAESLAVVVAQGPHGEDVVRFADRAEYLASFAHELARGHAWSLWYYSPFEGLSSLPAGAAIAGMMAREPEYAEDVLLRLDRWGELDDVLDLLSGADAEMVWALFTDPNGVAAPGRQTLDAVLAVWPAVHLDGRRLSGAANALRLYVAVLRYAQETGLDDLPAAISLLLGFAGMLASTGKRGALVEAVAAGELRAAVTLLHDSGAGHDLSILPQIIGAAGGDQTWITEAARIIAPTAGGPGAEDRAPAALETAITAFGGIFLLLPVLLDLRLDRLLTEIGGEDDGVALLRHLLAIACFGRDRALAAALDPVLARVCGLQRSPSFEELEEAAAGLTPEVSEACQRFLAGALARQGRIDGRYLAADLLSLPFGGDVLLLRDTAHDVWLYAAPAGEECGPQLQRALELVSDWADIQPVCLLVNAELDRRLGGSAPAGLPRDLIWLDPDSALPPDHRDSLAEYQARARPALDDLLYLSPAGLHPLKIPAGHANLTLCLLARALLRGFASRLIGFEWSSCSFLHRNFLAGISSVRFEPDRIAVQLARPPLHVILSLTGSAGQSYQLPWLDGAGVTVWLAEE